MGIPKSKFDDWKSTGADHGSRRAAKAIERLLHQDRSPVEQNDCTFSVIRQGSYKNTTHTYGSSDVDVLAILESTWRRDLSELTQDERERYLEDKSSPDYTYPDFRDDVWRWVKNKISWSNRRWNGKAIELSDDAGRLPIDADLVPCVRYRVYKSYPEYGDPDIDKGIAFQPRRKSDWIYNYPEIHYQNGTQKHSNYKETVRIFKNARDYYNKNSSFFRSIDAHSYGIECLIYNVPRRILKRTNRADRFDEILSYLDNKAWSSFDQVSEKEALFGSSNTQWDTAEADELVSRLRKMWNKW